MKTKQPTGRQVLATAKKIAADRKKYLKSIGRCEYFWSGRSKEARERLGWLARWHLTHK
jgi:hypothetical protein